VVKQPLDELSRLSPDGKYFFFLELVSVPWQCEVFRVSVEAPHDLNTVAR